MSRQATRYAWKDGCALRGNIDPQAAGRELDRIRRQDGLTAGAVVDAARSPVSPLHEIFVWDDTEAAERYRRDQAQDLIRSVVIRRVEQAPGSPIVRAFVSVAAEGSGREYVPITDALTDPGQRQQVLERARAELNSWQRRYRDFKELAHILDAVAAAEQEQQAA